MTKEPIRVKTRYYEVGAVRKALTILCAFTPERPSLTVSDMSRLLQLPKSTVFNLLSTLQKFDFVSQDPVSKHYQLGRKVFELGSLFSRRSSLVACALPYLRRLSEQTKETVKLGVLAGTEALIMSAIESPLMLHTRGDSGHSASLYCTSVGKAILALIPEEEIPDLIAKVGLRPLTPRTITTLARLKREIEEIRANGYAVDWEENEEGVRCIGAPITEASGSERAAISVSAPASRFTTERIPEIATLVLEAAKSISIALGKKDDEV